MQGTQMWSPVGERGSHTLQGNLVHRLQLDKHRSEDPAQPEKKKSKWSLPNWPRALFLARGTPRPQSHRCSLLLLPVYSSVQHTGPEHPPGAHRDWIGSQTGETLRRADILAEETGCAVVMRAGEEIKAEEEVPVGVSGIVFSKREDFKKVKELTHL